MTDDPYIGKTIGSFRLEEKLGEGGMGAVYRAVHTRLEREVAFKVLPGHLVHGNKPFVERFFTEARAAARVDHPNVVRVYDAEELDGVHYIAMEFVRGMDLQDTLQARGRLAATEALEIALQAARGLGAAADSNVIHRDIKPANLMITPEGTVKVADFGLAKNLDSATHLTQSGQIMGTPSYMSPEQAEGEKTDFRTDIYALGVSLFEMVTGQRPFKAETALGLLRKHCEAPVPNPCDVNPGLNPAVAPIIRRMMAKKPADRYGSYGELVSALEVARAAVESGAPSPETAGSGDPMLSSLYVVVEETLKSGVLEAGETPAAARPPSPPAGALDREPSTAETVAAPAAAGRRGLHPALWVVSTLVLVGGVAALLFGLGVIDLNEKALTPQGPGHGGGGGGGQDGSPEADADREAGDLLGQARARHAKGEHAEALALLDRVAGEYPASAAAAEVEKLSAAWGKERDDRERDGKVRELLGRARALMKRGKLEEALAAVREVRKIGGDPGYLGEDIEKAVKAAEHERAKLAQARERRFRRFQDQMKEAVRLSRSRDPKDWKRALESWKAALELADSAANRRLAETNIQALGKRLGPSSKPSRDPSPYFGSRLAGARRRAALRNGGSRSTESAVDRGLGWLAQAQDRKGEWSCQLWGGRKRAYDQGVTALALLAFLGAGHTHQDGRYRDSVRRGMDFLLGRQMYDGCLGDQKMDYQWIYSHCMATLALVEACALTGDRKLWKPVEKAVKLIVDAQNPYLGWRYGKKPGDSDTSVTSWAVAALAAAGKAGFPVPRSSFAGARIWLDKATDGAYHRVRYTLPREGSRAPIYTGKAALAQEAMTAAGVYCRILMGAEASNRHVMGGGNLLLRKLPVWDVKGGAVNMYYWYFGTLATFQMGGDYWKRWNETLRGVLLANQVSSKNPRLHGSWNPEGFWGGEGGRVYATALCTLILETYYRYHRVWGADPVTGEGGDGEDEELVDVVLESGRLIRGLKLVSRKGDELRFVHVATRISYFFKRSEIRSMAPHRAGKGGK